MNAMILAAGLGVRLLPHTKRIPKPLFPILDKTLLQLAIETALGAGPDIIVVNTHHLAGKIAEFLNGRDFGGEIKISHEPELLGTAGGIKAAEKWLKGGDFAVVNSDIIVEVDFEAMLGAHRAAGAVATLMLRDNPDTERYGSVCVNDDGKVTRFLTAKNSDYEESQKLLMFTGVSILSPGIFERIPAGRPVEISSEIYSPMVKAGEPLYGFASKAAWTEAGTVENYHKAVMSRFDTHSGKIGIPEKKLEYVRIRPPVHIDPKVFIRAGSTIGPKVAIHSGSVIGASVLLKNCVVTPGSSVRNGAVLEGEVI